MNRPPPLPEGSQLDSLDAERKIERGIFVTLLGFASAAILTAALRSLE